MALANAQHLSVQAALQSLLMLDVEDLQESLITEVTEKISSAIEQYQTAAAAPELLIQSKLNLIDLFVDVHTRLSSMPTWAVQSLAIPALNSAAEEALRALPTLDFETLPAIESVYARLNLGQNLLVARQLNLSEVSTWQTIDLPEIRQLVRGVKLKAIDIGNDRALSLALGISAQVEEP